MGSANDKPRKRRRPLPKVPKYEEPNTLPLPGLTGDSGLGNTSGRFGHGSDGKEHHAPGRAGRALLRVLGMRRRDPEAEDAVTRDKTFDELAIDSLDKINISFEIEDAFNIQIPDDSIGSLKTVGDVIDGVIRLQHQAAAQPAPTAI